MIDLFTFCYNEEFMIPFFIRHYSTIVDSITVYDNKSTDRSCEILIYECLKYRIPLTIIKYDTENQQDEFKLIELKSTVWKDSKADYVIVCDMDEFIDLCNFENELEKRYSIYKLEGYQMYSKLEELEYLKPITEQIRTGIKDTLYDKCILFKPTINEIKYSVGAHVCYNDNIYNSNIKLLHYKNIGINRTLKLFKERQFRTNKMFELNMDWHYRLPQQEIIDKFEIGTKQQII